MINFVMKSFLMYIVSMFFPIIGFFIPIIGIKEFRSNKKNNILVGHLIISFLILLLFNLNFVIHYIFIYVGMEIIFIFLDKKNNFNIYQKVIITSLVFTIFIGLYIKININQMEQILNETQNIYVSNFGFDKENIELVMQTLEKYFLSIIFIYFFFENYMIYFILKKDQKSQWDFNYYLLLIYILVFFLKNILQYNNNYIINILLILKIPYIFYGIRKSYEKLEKVIKNKFLRSLMVISVTMISYNIMFIIGSIISFKIFKEGIEDESNITKRH
ncbi:MAG: hypothetical protein ACQERZ_00965 [Fusobacteriota bacterium]